MHKNNLSFNKFSKKKLITRFLRKPKINLIIKKFFLIFFKLDVIIFIKSTFEYKQKLINISGIKRTKN